MDELIIETGPRPQISVTSQGKLYIKGWERTEIRASASGKDKLSIWQDGDNVNVQSLSHCEMRVPYEASVTIQSANGETILKAVTGNITVHQASAGLTLNDVGPVLVDDVSRDLNAQEVHGDLIIHHANRFVNASFIKGNFSADSIAAHLTLKKVEGNISASVLGNATLGLEPKPGQTCTVEAHGVLTCHLSPQANATVELSGPGPLVTQLGGKTETARQHHTLTLGDGSAQIFLTGYGPVTVLEGETGKPAAGFTFDFEDMELEMDTLSQQISRQVTEQLEMQMGLLDAQMEALLNSGNLSEEKAARIRARTDEKISRAQEKIARAQERAAEKIEQARRKSESGKPRSGKDFTYGGMDAAREGVRTGMSAAREGVRIGLTAARESISSVLGSSKAAPADPVSDEERMMILNMLAEKKISIQEAESLLAALEGRNQ
ncbi:MAG TPA: hypothetical protein PK530_20115 [Anaerolineales bacterium]|nr:hypothetical protein [Anaerolineales bacterium]